VNRRLDQGIESVSSVLSREARRDVPAAPANPASVTRVLRQTQPVVTENQKVLLLAGQKLLAHDRARAIRQFPDLVHLQS